MKRLAFFILFFIFITAQASFAKAPKKIDTQPTVVAPVVTLPSPAEVESMARETLNKKEWQIYVTLIGNSRAKPHSDTLTFYGSKVSSKRFTAKGYVESNYTIRTQPDGTPTWETTQKNEKEEIVFWKGELRGEEMMGVFSYQPKKGPNEDFSFTTLAPTINLKKP
ncbi:MAG: hypothetical protein WCL25_01660 [bacterium]